MPGVSGQVDYDALNSYWENQTGYPFRGSGYLASKIVLPPINKDEAKSVRFANPSEKMTKALFEYKLLHEASKDEAILRRANEFSADDTMWRQGYGEGRAKLDDPNYHLELCEVVLRLHEITSAHARALTKDLECFKKKKAEFEAKAAKAAEEGKKEEASKDKSVAEEEKKNEIEALSREGAGLAQRSHELEGFRRRCVGLTFQAFRKLPSGTTGEREQSLFYRVGIMKLGDDHPLKQLLQRNLLSLESVAFSLNSLLLGPQLMDAAEMEMLLVFFKMARDKWPREESMPEASDWRKVLNPLLSSEGSPQELATWSGMANVWRYAIIVDELEGKGSNVMLRLLGRIGDVSDIVDRENPGWAGAQAINDARLQERANINKVPNSFIQESSCSDDVRKKWAETVNKLVSKSTPFNDCLLRDILGNFPLHLSYNVDTDVCCINKDIFGMLSEKAQGLILTHMIERFLRYEISLPPRKRGEPTSPGGFSSKASIERLREVSRWMRDNKVSGNVKNMVRESLSEFVASSQCEGLSPVDLAARKIMAEEMCAMLAPDECREHAVEGIYWDLALSMPVYVTEIVKGVMSLEHTPAETPEDMAIVLGAMVSNAREMRNVDWGAFKIAYKYPNNIGAMLKKAVDRAFDEFDSLGKLNYGVFAESQQEKPGDPNEQIRKIILSQRKLVCYHMMRSMMIGSGSEHTSALDDGIKEEEEKIRQAGEKLGKKGLVDSLRFNAVVVNSEALESQMRELETAAKERTDALAKVEKLEQRQSSRGDRGSPQIDREPESRPKSLKERAKELLKGFGEWIGGLWDRFKNFCGKSGKNTEKNYSAAEKEGNEEARQQGKAEVRDVDAEAGPAVLSASESTAHKPEGKSRRS